MAGSTFHAVLLVLVSTSYLFVLYGTEARGYSPLLLFLWLVYDTGENLVQEFSVRRIAVFSIAVLLAALSHLSALTFIAAVLIGLIPRVGFMRATIAGIFPVVLVGVLWFTFISKLAQASGDIGNELLAIINIFSVGFGGPAVGATLQGVFAFIVAPIVAISLLFLVFLSVRKKDEQALFFAAGIFMLPIATWLVYQPGYTYARHFLPALFVAYLCVARRMALVFESQQPQMVRGVIFVLMLFIGGNAANNFTLCVYGRGGYEKIVQLLADDRGAIVSDRPFRHQALLKHYSENLSSGLAVLKGQNDGLPEWVQMKESEAAEPKWFLSIGNPYETPKEVDLAHFELVGVFPSAPLSGWEVQLFKTLPGKNVR
ncbi:MAG: hypothetical protein KDD70_11430 [Bdellovibrionales bacterium]|nr:hypothetical protein [Bdellovibrionales bacterium]